MSLLSHSPQFDRESAARLAEELYGVCGSVTVLPSERDQNFLLATDTGERFVLKIANSKESRPLLEAQNAVLALLRQRGRRGTEVVPAISGDLIAETRAADRQQHWVRLLTYVPGVAMGTLRRHPPELLRDVGRAVGDFDAALGGFDHPALHRDFHWDLRHGTATCQRYAPLVTDHELRDMVERLLADHELHVAPLLTRLPCSVIHNDANDYNVIVDTDAADGDVRLRNTRVAALVDLGDMVVSYTVGDLAVAIAYAMLDKTDPMAVMASVVAGYHAARALSDDELAALFGLACLRLCMSVCIAAHQTQQRPDDAYLSVSQQAVRRTLPRLARIPRGLAEAVARQACGREPVRGGGRVRAWLGSLAGDFAPVLDADPRVVPTVVLDLSIGSPLVSGDPADNSEPKLTARIAAAMKDVGAALGIGRYGEARPLYQSPLFAMAASETAASETAEWRTVHLGIDLFAEPGTGVHAPLEGTVHALANNARPLDYGPVIVLAHRLDDGTVFHSLYGHLSVESLSGLRVGQRVARGERIASLGAPSVNGGWTPHLHFQLIADTLELGTDFPGVAPASLWPVWTSFSPDPTALLRLPAGAAAGSGSAKVAALAARRAHLGGNLSLAYDAPLMIERGWMQYLFDENGRRYLDAYNNVPHVGHAHPVVTRAARDQMAVLNTNTRYLHELVNRYAERLCATLDASLSVCYFVNSGSEANELALRLARAHTGRRDIAVLDAAYHGNTTTLIDISPYKHDGPGGSGAPDWVHLVPLPDLYRGTFRRDDPDAGPKYARHVADAAARARNAGRRLGAFIAESCPSVGGQILLPAGYLGAVYEIVRKERGVCIADEVQTGFGRLGTHFWGFETQGVVPDIVVLGKPMGNGHPIGAVITTRAIAASFDNGMEFFSTFGGNPVSCAIGLAVLDVMRDEGLQGHALRVGNRLLSGLRSIALRHAIVGEVRGSGLFLGVELVRDRMSLEPAAAEASYVVNRIREEGILLGTDGPLHNVVKIRPPMPFDASNADRLVETFDGILGELAP